MDAPIDQFDCDGYRPIHRAIITHNLELGRRILMDGALLNKGTESGDGALILLCKALHDEEAIEWIPLLCENGAELIGRDRLGWTALHHCVSRGLVQSARLLIKEGADPILKNFKGERPIDLIPEEGSPGVSRAVWTEILSIR